MQQLAMLILVSAPICITAWLSLRVIDGATLVPVMQRTYAVAGIGVVVAAVLASNIARILLGM